MTPNEKHLEYGENGADVICYMARMRFVPWHAIVYI